MNRQAMAEALEGLSSKYPAANITQIKSTVVEDNTLEISIDSKDPFGNEVGEKQVNVRVNIDAMPDVPDSEWAEGDEAHLLDLMVNMLHIDSTGAPLPEFAPGSDEITATDVSTAETAAVSSE